jgi:hypothetical protein
MNRTALVLCLAALALFAVSPGVAQADDVPDFWTGPNNGMAVFGWSGGQLAVPFVVAHVAQAEVSCTLFIYTMRGPTEIPVASVPMGTFKATDKYFCNVDSGGELPFTFIWDDLTLDPGTYQCRVTAYDGTAWAVSDLRCPVQIMSTPDTTPPVETITDYDGLWHRSPWYLYFTIVDDPNGWGGRGGQSHVDYSLDGGATWRRGGSVEFRARKRGGGSGIQTVLFRGMDAAGNEEPTTHSLQVLIDARAPVTTDDAPLTPQSSDVTVHLTAADSMFGVTACSGVAATRYSVDGGRWLSGTQVVVPAARNAGVHWIAYYSTDNAGNAEYAKCCSVTIAATAGAAGAAHVGPSR